MNTPLQDLLKTRDSAWRFPGSVYDNFCAYHAIATHDRSLLPADALAQILQLLVSIEQQPGGPYYSQFSEKGKKKGTIDHKTNAAIARFLALYDIELPALTGFLGAIPGIAPEGKRVPRRLGRMEAAMLQKIRSAVKKRLSGTEPAFRAKALAVIERTVRGNPDRQMSLMPLYMREALGKKGRHIPESLIIEMGMANIFFWTAFIIYDDFWDEDEAAEPGLLPIANLFARTYTDFFASLFSEKTAFRAFFHDLMDKLDEANAWETRHCRAEKIEGGIRVPKALPNYKHYERKYRPASGHILGPLALLLKAGYSLRSKEAVHLIDYFKHYLIAMQFNDDMHDWEEDLRRGHISTVIDLLVRDAKLEGKKIVIDRDLQQLREVFWFTTLPGAAKKSLAHSRQSRQALLAMRSIEDIAPLERYVRMTETVATEALAEQRRSVAFIGAYGTQGKNDRH